MTTMMMMMMTVMVVVVVVVVIRFGGLRQSLRWIYQNTAIDLYCTTISVSPDDNDDDDDDDDDDDCSDDDDGKQALRAGGLSSGSDLPQVRHGHRQLQKGGYC